MKKELRVLNLTTSSLAVEKRNGAFKSINGYAAVFDKDSEDMGFIERIDKKAFRDTDLTDVRGLFNHDANLIFARSGVNLSLKVDKTGLFMEVEPINTSTFNMVAENIAAGLVTQQSYAFTVAKDEWNEDYTERTILGIDKVFDVSPVTYPAYPDTTVALRAIRALKGEEIDIQEEIERLSAQLNQLRSLVNPDLVETPLSHEPQSMEELERRFFEKLNKRKGF
jgi:HK97 family phage prohead protease